MAWVVTAVTVAIEIGTVAAIATAVAQVGLAMTVVGTVTKSKELTSVGKFLSVAGGVTAIGANLVNMATSAAGTAGASGAAGAAAGEAGASTALQDAAKEAMVNQAAETGAETVATQAAGGGLINGAQGIAQNASYGIDGLSGLADAGTSALGVEVPGQAALGGFAAPTPIVGDQAMQAAVPQFATGGAAPVAGAATSSTATPSSWFTGASEMAKTPKSGESVGNWFKNLDAPTKNALVQGGLGAIGGLSQSFSASQKLDLEKQIADERIKSEQTQRANANAIPSLRFQPVGLVNRAIGG